MFLLVRNIMPGMEKLEEELVSRALQIPVIVLSMQGILPFFHTLLQQKLYSTFKGKNFHWSLLHQHAVSRVTYWSKVGLV